MEIEDEVESTIEQHIREKQELEVKLTEQEKTISEKNQLIEELKKQLEKKKNKK